MTPASDVYGLGALLYATLTGRAPFSGETALDTLVQVLERDPAPPRQLRKAIPATLETICLRCLEKRPQERYPGAQAVAEDLERFLRGEAIESPGGSVGQSVKRWARREPALAARLAAIALCAVIVQVNYLSAEVGVTFHLQTLAILASWGAVSWLCQRMLNRGVAAVLVGVVWSACDVLLLTLLIWSNDELASPVIVTYAILVAGAGLWLQPALVWLTTLFAALAYGVLVVDACLRVGRQPLHHHAIFALLLGVLGYITAYQVRRLRSLGRG